MANTKPAVIYLKDYQQPNFWIDETHLDVQIGDGRTRVVCKLKLRPNKAATGGDLVLNGSVDMELLSLQWEGAAIDVDNYSREGDRLTIRGIVSAGWLSTEVAIVPESNTTLEGLYRSRTMYCTQCEAEGFRNITWYLDRPDVMSVFTTRIEADKVRCPVLLSNGNLVTAGDVGNGRHFAQWHDPFPKPAYLFALVAGELEKVVDEFVTVSGKVVAIEVYVESKDVDKCGHAIDSLKRAMHWDEQHYGREYDLEIYMIVAVDDFNMGAMENKGLNIFNTSCVLASQETATDNAFQRVEAVVAHEYFHNWSGNRVTCRDWFQLSLKEGFTVFRDAQFSGDMNSTTVKRIEDVNLLRSAQFAEDSGPLAHPVRPASFIEISNFYTLTVYEKGAEIVRMLALLLGAEKFRRATDLYFERYDGQAVTCDDFLACMAEVSGRDLTQFSLWYAQAGTPELTVSDDYDPVAAQYRLRIRQTCAPTPEADVKVPFFIPVRIGLLGEAGAIRLQCGALNLSESADNTDGVLELTESEQEFVFEQVHEKPVPSLLRGFSAPVKLHYDFSQTALLRLLCSDDDLFNRWNAAQYLGVNAVSGAIAQAAAGEAVTLCGDWVAALAQILGSDTLDKAVVAYILQLPSVSYLHDQLAQHDIVAVIKAREAVVALLADALLSDLWQAFNCNVGTEDYAPTTQQISQRCLKNASLALLVYSNDPKAIASAEQMYRSADNMTDQLAALRALVNSTQLNAVPVATWALADFYQRWQGEALVVNQWLSVQAADQKSGAIERLEALLQHPSFSWSNPNKVRAVISVFANQNLAQFHDQQGLGYTWLASAILRLNKANPQIASRLVTPLTRWRNFGPVRGQLMRKALQHIAAQDLSADVYEVVNKSL